MASICQDWSSTYVFMASLIRNERDREVAFDSISNLSDTTFSIRLETGTDSIFKTLAVMFVYVVYRCYRK